MKRDAGADESRKRTMSARKITTLTEAAIKAIESEAKLREEFERSMIILADFAKDPVGFEKRIIERANAALEEFEGDA